MDKRVIFAVAGSGKTTYIVDSLSREKRTLIVTYTINNYHNLLEKIMRKFDGELPDNITVMTYFRFLYGFCYKPFLSDDVKAKGIFFDKNTKRYIPKTEDAFYLTEEMYFYSNRLAMFIEQKGAIEKVQNRIETYFDEFIVDEVQDIAGRDFDFIKHLMRTNINMLFVGDFYQHTFNTSRDGKVNKSLFDSFSNYEAQFTKNGFVSDSQTLIRSWRCGKRLCDYITDNLGIQIDSNRKDDESNIFFNLNQKDVARILEDDKVIKLHYQNAAKYGENHRNWGDVKGEDCYQDVCVLLNKTTVTHLTNGNLKDLLPSTRNKLYVAITRAHGNCYLVDEKAI